MPNKYTFDLLYSAIPFPIEIIDKEGKIVFINKEFIKLWGYGLNELLEYNFFEDNEIKRRDIQNKIKKELNDSDLIINRFVDSLLKQKDSTLPILQTKIFNIVLEDNEYTVLFHQDQTEGMLNEAEIIKAREGNKEAERLKDTFLNVLSHELRTPLNIILGYSAIIKDSMKDKITSEDKVYLDNLYSGSERLFKSITQMLEFAQIEAGNFTMNPQVFDLVPLLLGSLSMIRDEAEKKEIQIKTSLKHKSVLVYADIQSTENVLNNLIGNAVKFTKQGFIELEVDQVENREVAICKIKDTGVGISTGYLDHLFRPFSQEDLNIGRNFEGNGLGLALSKRYIEKMGGSLLVDSIKGVGTTFTFTLPLFQKEEKKSGKQSHKDLKNVFMIDSDRESLDLLKAYLKNKFIITSSPYSSFNIALLKEKKYEIILMDVDQGYWDEGINLCNALKEDLNIQILVITSEYLHEKIALLKNAGASRVIIKPFSKVELLKIIDDAVSDRLF